MSDYCVVVAGGTAARIFTLESPEFPELESGPNLVERTALSNPMQAGEFRSGAAHDRELTKKFARDIAAAVERTVQRTAPQHVVLCADSRLLGALRPNLNGNLHGQVALHEVPKDLGKLSCAKLHESLSRTGHLPRRRRRASA